MAFVKTSNIVADNGDVYADTAAWIAAHGPCGTENIPFCTGTMTLNEAKNGVQIVLTYVDEATHDAHMVAVADVTKAGTTHTLVSAV
jgi:hypothetical protein